MPYGYVWLIKNFKKLFVEMSNFVLFMSLADQGGYFAVDPGQLSNLR